PPLVAQVQRAKISHAEGSVTGLHGHLLDQRSKPISERRCEVCNLRSRTRAPTTRFVTLAQRRHCIRKRTSDGNTYKPIPSQRDTSRSWTSRTEMRYKRSPRPLSPHPFGLGQREVAPGRGERGGEKPVIETCISPTIVEPKGNLSVETCISPTMVEP